MLYYFLLLYIGKIEIMIKIKKNKKKKKRGKDSKNFCLFFSG